MKAGDYIPRPPNPPPPNPPGPCMQGPQVHSLMQVRMMHVRMMHVRMMQLIIEEAAVGPAAAAAVGSALTAPVPSRDATFWYVFISSSEMWSLDNLSSSSATRISRLLSFASAKLIPSYNFDKDGAQDPVTNLRPHPDRVKTQKSRVIGPSNRSVFENTDGSIGRIQHFASRPFLQPPAWPVSCSAHRPDSSRRCRTRCRDRPRCG